MMADCEAVFFIKLVYISPTMMILFKIGHFLQIMTYNDDVNK